MMREKQLYHTALERNLLNGRSVKRAVLARVGEKQGAALKSKAKARGKDWTPRPLPWIAVPVTALLLLVTLTVGVAAGAAGFKTRRADETTDPVSEHTVSGAVTADAAVRDHAASIRLLPELAEAEEFAGQRQAHGQPPFSEEDWGWIRNMQLSVERVTLDNTLLSWVTKVRVQPIGATEQLLNPFTNEGPGQQLDFFPEEAYCKRETADDAAKAIDTFNIGSGYTFAVEGGWLTMYVPTTFYLPSDFTTEAGAPASDTVSVTQQFRIIDNRVDSQAYIATLAEIEQSFRFDLETLQTVAEPTRVPVPLAGECVLTVEKEGHTGYRNERLSLEGVVLDAKIRYTQKGILVSFAVSEAPEAWTSLHRQALLRAMAFHERQSRSYYSVNGEAKQETWRFDRGADPEDACILVPIEPSDYGAVQLLTLDMTASHIVAADNQTPREDWEWDSTDGELPLETTVEAAQLVTVTVPLP